MTHHFGGFHLYVAGFDIETAWWKGMVEDIHLPYGIQETDKEQRSQGQEYSLQGHDTSNSSLHQTPPPNSTFSYGFIIGLLHQQGNIPVSQLPSKIPASEHMRILEDILDLNDSTYPPVYFKTPLGFHVPNLMCYVNSCCIVLSREKGKSLYVFSTDAAITDLTTFPVHIC